MHLIEGFADADSSPFELHLHHGDAVDQEGDIVAICHRAFLLKLVDDLQAVAAHMVFVHEIDVLQSSVVELEIADVIYLHSSGLFDDGCPGFVEILQEKTLPLLVGEGEMVELLELCACVFQQSGGTVELWQILIS